MLAGGSSSTGTVLTVKSHQEVQSGSLLFLGQRKSESLLIVGNAIRKRKRGLIGPLSHRLIGWTTYLIEKGILNLMDFFREDHRRYALSTLKATLRTYYHWMRQGYSEKHSMDNAIKYGVAQIQSIVTPVSIRDSLEDFEMISKISQRLADVLQVRLQGADAEKRVVESQV